MSQSSFSFKSILYFSYFLLALLALLVTNVLAHAEKDKARFVANQGVDTGFCDNPLRPCKTIAFAVQTANKGDKVLVAAGSYTISSTEELFYLKSEIVPIFAGFNRFDHFQSQSPNVNPTFLLGVPESMAKLLREKGFSVINDGKSHHSAHLLEQKMTDFHVLNTAQAEINCVNGTAGSFPCQNIDLVAHVPLSGFSSKPSSGNDVWGHIDLNTGTEYAIMGVRNGVAVFNLSDPANPVEVGFISGTPAAWRDIKVYQYFDQSLNTWKAYAYSTVDGAADGVSVIDLNNLPGSISLVELNKSVDNAHNVYISNIDYSLNIQLDDSEPVLQLVGANKASGSFNSYSLANPNTLQIKNNQSSFGGYTHDGASVLIDDSRKDSDCFNATLNCSVFVDFNEKEMILWDITQPADTKMLSQIGYDDVPKENQYVHSGWVTENKRFILLHDEFDESRGGLNSTVRIFQIDSLRNPVQVGQWTGPTRAVDHNGFVRGNRYYMSNYERGLTVLDITDPANPTEAGYFDTFPSSDNAGFSGAWGVYPFLPSGLILVSDINSGLYVLRDKTQSATQGSVKFDINQIEVDQGVDAVINVTRVNTLPSSTSVSVKYEMLSGSASKGSDFTATTGTLEWNGNEAGIKTLTLPIAADSSGVELKEKFYIRLYDPSSGLTLSTPSYLTVNVKGLLNTGAIELAETSVVKAENSGLVTINVNRVGGSEGAASVSYQLIDNTAIAGQDYESTQGVLQWNDGDSAAKSFQVNLINDTETETDESFIVTLSSVSGATLGTKSTMNVIISDDESNTAPVVSLSENFEVNTGQSVTLTSTVTDAENDTLTYVWQQTGGVSVSINNANQSQASFVAPASAGEIDIVLTVTDSKGAQSSDTVKISVVAPLPPLPPETAASSSGGGTSFWILILTLAIPLRFVKLAQVVVKSRL